jgi:Uma2 family endonuclease
MLNSASLHDIEQDLWSGEPGEIKVVPLGRPATIADLSRTRLKAEIVGGELVVIGPSGAAPATAAGNIAVSLHQHRKRGHAGRALGARVAYVVDLPHRLALCPDAGWYTGELSGTGFPRGAPIFAAEVRDDLDHGDEAEGRLAATRADYFAAGTQVVWDVDVLRGELIRVYRAGDPEAPMVYRRGEVAEAEPAVPGWRFPVDELFD